MSPDSEVKPVYHHRKLCYKYQRSQRDYPIKKRKLYYDHSSVPKPDRGISCKGITSFPGKKFSCDASASSATMCGGLFPSLPFLLMGFCIFSRGLVLVLSLGSSPNLIILTPHAASGKPVCLPGQYGTFQSEDSHGM